MFEGDIIDLGERKLEVVHVPGHTPGSITLLDREERCLIGGDPIQIDGEIYMFGLHRDMEAYVFGLEHLLERAGEFDGIYPSHMQLQVPCSVIPELIQGVKDVLSGIISGTVREVHGRKILCYDIEIDRFLCDLQEQEETLVQEEKMAYSLKIKQEVVDHINQGMPIETVSQMYNISRQSINNWIKSQEHYLSETRKAFLVSLYRTMVSFIYSRKLFSVICETGILQKAWSFLMKKRL